MSDLNRLNPGRHSLHSRDNLSRGESRLHDLIMQAESWRHTAQALEARLPAKLQQHCRAVRVREGVLVWYASNNMAAARLRMLAAGLLPAWRAVCPEVREVQVKISPPEQERPKRNRPNSAAPPPNNAWPQRMIWRTTRSWQRRCGIWQGMQRKKVVNKAVLSIRE